MSITFKSFWGFFQKDFDFQMEIEKEKYEKRLQEALEVMHMMIYKKCNLLYTVHIDV